VRFDPAHYVRHPVLLWEDWEVMVIGWEAGQVTPIHDHRGVLGGMAILSGTVVEERFSVANELPELADSRVRPEGDLSETGPTVLHRLMPRSRSVSLHIYRPPLRTMGIWDPRAGFQEIRPSVFEVDEEVLARGSERQSLLGSVRLDRDSEPGVSRHGTCYAKVRRAIRLAGRSS
jgi:predicted metal-dependent enzyme (double-stranded beta helix superfamily)